MVRSLVIACLFMASAVPCLTAAPRTFTDVKGRRMVAEMVDAGDTWIEVKGRDGRLNRIARETLSGADEAWVSEWVAQRKSAEKHAAAAAEKTKRAAEIPAKLVGWVRSQMGRQVGNGECWTLADEAFKACGLKRPGKDMRVWGRLIDPKKEKPQPGDIAEFRSAKFKDGSWTGPEHTAVVTRGPKSGRLLLAEQNWSGRKTVREREFDPEGLIKGELLFYRPE